MDNNVYKVGLQLTLANIPLGIIPRVYEDTTLSDVTSEYKYSSNFREFFSEVSDKNPYLVSKAIYDTHGKVEPSIRYYLHQDLYRSWKRLLDK